MIGKKKAGVSLLTHDPVIPHNTPPHNESEIIAISQTSGILRGLLINCVMFFYLSVSCNSYDRQFYSVDLKAEIKSIASKYVSDEIANRYTEVILYNAERRNINPFLIAYIIEVESRFKWWRVSHKGAIGSMGVMPEYWLHLLYAIPDKKLQKKLKKANDPKIYISRIGYNIYMGTEILNYYIKYCKGDIMLGLLAYNHGQNTKVFRQAKKEGINFIKKQDYIQKVIYGRNIY